MATPFWNTGAIGCIERDSFRLKSVPRTAVTSVGSNPIKSKKADVRAPLEASFTCVQTQAQYTAFVQWYRVDLAGGVRPFMLDIWMWDHYRHVRAKFLGAWRARQQSYDEYQLTGTFEIERESIA